MNRNVWNTKSLSEALGVEVPLSLNTGKIEFNSKDIEEGDLFVALPGGARDSHEFVQDAFQKGAAAAIVSKKIDDPRAIFVYDTAIALDKLARYKRANCGAKFIGVTGSVGKTSTKEALGIILSNFAPSFRSRSTFNNHIGVPLTVASVPDDAVYCVNEMGMNHAGEIRALTGIVKPDVAIITKIAEAHLENLGSVENICKAKCEIFEGLEKTGFAIINKDSPYFPLQKLIIESLKIENCLIFSESSQSDCFVSNFQTFEEYSLVEYNIFGKTYKAKNFYKTKHQAVNFGSAMLAIYALGLDLEMAAYFMEKVKPYGGRGLTTTHKINGTKFQIIDDAYNANPASMSAAFVSLDNFKGNKIAILGDMRELGDLAPQMHKNLKPYIIQSGVKKLFLVGEMMKYLHDDIKDDIESHHFSSANKDVFSEIFEMVKNEDSTILVKGSKTTLVRGFVDYIDDIAKGM